MFYLKKVDYSWLIPGGSVGGSVGATVGASVGDSVGESLVA